MFRSLNASRATFVRVAAHQTAAQSRSFLTTPIRRADLVQDLYIKAINAHKPTPVKASDAEGQVQKFAVPAAPRSPEESNIASELKSYEDQAVEVEGAAAEGEIVAEQDWFEEPEDDEWKNSVKKE